MKITIGLKRCALILVFTCGFLKAVDYESLRARYSNFEDNDERAFRFVDAYIRQAKNMKAYNELAQAYRDAASFSVKHKLAYADSAIDAAQRSCDPDILGNAYLTKGSIFYFTLRQYRSALDAYLKAWAYLKKSDNRYLYYKNIYHIALVKSYLGDNDEALRLYDRCLSYYKICKLQKEGTNKKYNTTKAYLNTLHQAAVCLLREKKIPEVETLVKEGLSLCDNDLNFDIERSYFYQLRGMLHELGKNDDMALCDLEVALTGILKKNDFTNASLIYFLKSKIYLRQHRLKLAYSNLQKVDSVFVHHHFVLPEAAEAYTLLIKHAHRKNDTAAELYYTMQQNRMDTMQVGDLKYLNAKMYKSNRIENLDEPDRSTAAFIIFGLAALLTAFFVFRIIMVTFIRKKVKRERIKMLILQPPPVPLQLPSEAAEKKSTKPAEELVVKILQGLVRLEQEHFYLKKGVRLVQVAKQLHTNTSYLSAIINEYKGGNFKTYINDLRISYVKNQLMTSALWRHYSIEDMATDCGFANRNVFTRIFTQSTGITPAEFVATLRKEPAVPTVTKTQASTAI